MKTRFKKGHFVPKGETSPGWKGGVAVNNRCIECNKKIWWGAKRCKKCNGKFQAVNKCGLFTKELNPNWKGGLPKCIDCGKTLTAYKYRRCSTCFKEYYKGEKTFLWKGGIESLAGRIRSIIEYKNWRNSVFERDNYTCQECFKRGGYLIAHHEKEFYKILQEFLAFYSQFSPIEDKEILVRLAVTYAPFWELINGKTLCNECHNKIKVKI